MFGGKIGKWEVNDKINNKLIGKLVSFFAVNNTFVSKPGNITNVVNGSIISEKSYSNKLLILVLKIK
jgi:hypothetical protein